VHLIKVQLVYFCTFELCGTKYVLLITVIDLETLNVPRRLNLPLYTCMYMDLKKYN